MLIGYSRPDRRFSAETQKALLLKAGVEERRIWVEIDRQGFDEYEEMNHLIGENRGLREGDILVVAWFHRLGATRRALQAHIKGITAKKCSIMEAASGRTSESPGDFADMIIEAGNFYAGRALVPSNPAERGKLGADASPMAKKKKGFMPAHEAIKFWRNPQYPSKEHALEAINADPNYSVEWTSSRAYRDLGPRDIPAGRRPANGERRSIAMLPSKKKRRKKGHVYFIRIDGTGDVKIGFSTSVAERRKSMDTGHPGKIDVIATIEGSRDLEQDLHRRFENYRKKGEWFSYEGAVKKFVESIPDDKLK